MKLLNGTYRLYYTLHKFDPLLIARGLSLA